MTDPVPMKCAGVKGSDVYDSTGSALLDLSVRLVRGADAAEVRAATAALAPEDAAVLAFHVRAVRGGRGERDLFYEMMRGLPNDLSRSLLRLVPGYGSWADVTALGECGIAGWEDLFIAQLQKDAAAEAGASISLAAKWAPREGKSYGAAAIALAHRMFPEREHGAAMRAYRKLLSGLNERLKTVETRMSSGRWAEIDPAGVPGRAGKLYARALLNLVGTTKVGETVPSDRRETLRKPDDADRMACRERFLAHFSAAVAGKAKVHGADTLFPHEIVKRAVGGMDLCYGTVGAGLTEGERDQLAAVWRSLVEKTAAGGGLGRCVMMSDFSGSMQAGSGGLPYWVSMALGILGAQVAGGAFARKLMTFDSTPKWHRFPEGADLFGCLQTLKDAGSIGVGASTDFQAALDLVLGTLKAERVRPGEEPENLVVLTDMGWDEACSSSQASVYTGARYRHHVKHAPWETHVEMIQESFRRAGEDLWGPGQGWKPPRIVVWNLAAPAGSLGTGHPVGALNLAASPLGTGHPADDLNLSATASTDFHARADVPGVAMLAGWSAAQFRVLCEVGPRQLTPLEILREELGHPRYDPVRQIVAEWRASTAENEWGGEGQPYACHADGVGQLYACHSDGVGQPYACHANGWGIEDA